MPPLVFRGFILCRAIPAQRIAQSISSSSFLRPQLESHVGIAIYDDRIEIENPGILLPQITPENIVHPHISYPYNTLIANVLYCKPILRTGVQA